ncbi:MAG: hypothetical protein IT290_02755 [Deltaproteobacteria bacterium]|nr:hypothetical protein [Deltaproteobacteria bacterium]
MQIPTNFKRAFTTDMIHSAVTRVGRQVTEWAIDAEQRTGEQVLAVCVLRGGAPFFVDLLRSVECSIEPAYCRTWAYSSDVNNQMVSGKVRVSVEEVVAGNRAIVIVDDICDTGATLGKLQRVFLDLGAAEVKSAVLIHRMVEKCAFRPDWSAFEYSGDEWFVGYGMEDRNRYSNLPEVYTILNS